MNVVFVSDATTTSKGQVTIPKEIRDRLGIEAGTELEFVLEDDGALTVCPKDPPMERLRTVRERLSDRDIDVDVVRRESKAA
ncbi:AbrB family transcriptional regulator [Halobacteriales archaeon QS_7_69_60]|nr:MAG: AbrB family transcriptional regulator [Halobacteriales archaeon QS_7_69_60]